MKRVLFVRYFNRDCGWGGLESRILEYLQRVDYNRYKVSIALNRDIYSEKIREAGIPVDVIHFPFNSTVGAWESFKKSYRFFKNQGADQIIFAQGAFTDFRFADFWAGFLATGGDIFALEALSPEPPERKLGGKYFNVIPKLELWWLKKMVPRRLKGWICKRIVTVGAEIRNALIEGYGYPAEKTLVVHNGVDIKSFAPDCRVRQDVRGELNIPADARVIVSTARFSKEKCLDRLMTAFCDAVGRFEHLYLLFLGEGPLKKDLEAVVEKKALGDRVFFHGLRRDVHRFLQASDIFVLPSDVEGLSSAMLEAMSCGLITVVTDVSGAKEVIHSGENGFVVERSGQGVLEGLFAALSLKPEETQAMAQKARKTIEEHFELEANIGRMLECLALR